MDPLILMIEPELDERAASATMSRAQRVYEEGSRDISRVMREQLTEGTQASGRAFDELADKARRAYLSMQDAGEKVAAAERKAEAARDKGASNVEALSRKVERARLDEVQAINRARDAYNEYDQAANRSARAATMFHEGLRSGLNNTVSDATAGYGVIGDAASSAFAGISTRAALAATGVGAIALAAVAAGKQLYDLGTTWDNISDGIAIRTGRVGDQLDSIVSTVRDLGGVTAAPLEAIGDVAGRVSQSLGLSGGELRDMTKTIADLNAMTGEQTDVKELGKTFRMFDIKNGADQIAALNSLLNASQATGVSVNELAVTLGTAGKSAKEFGLGFGETAALLTSFEEAGVDLAKIGPAMTIALRNFAKAGQEPQQGLRDTIAEIKNLSDAGNDMAATDLASKTFGRGYIDFLDAIKGGNLDVDALTKSLDGQGQSIEDLRNNTADWSEEWQKLKNTISSVFAPAANAVFTEVNTTLEGTVTGLKTIGDVIAGLGHGWEMVADAIEGKPIHATIITGAFQLGPDGKPVPIGQPAPAANPLDALSGAAGGGVPGSLNDALGLGAPPAGPTVPLPGIRPNPWGTVGPGQYKDWYPDNLAKDNKSLPPAPVLPLQYTNTAGLPSPIANATTRLDDTKHDVAEKEARVNQLLQSNIATERDIQEARNQLAKANQSQQQAEQALTDARINEAKRASKELDKMSDTFGNKLDADFGISKGLGGIVENFVKAAGNILAAPFLQALGMVEKANQNEGSGLVGILAANGAFGSKYTPAAIAAANAAQSSGGGVGTAAPYTGGAYPGDAALLSAVPAGSYSQTQAADLTKGIGDCSSAVEDLVNILDGRPTEGRSMSTGNEADWLQSHGFLPGMGGPGDFRVGFNGGHTQATLPGGTPFNWGSDAAAARGGVGGTGADDPAFTDHWYRPVGGVPANGTPAVTAAPSAAPDIYGPGNTDPGLTSPGAPGWGTPGIPSTIMPGAGGQGPIFGATPQGPGVGASAGMPLGAGGGGRPYPSTGGNSGNAVGGLALDGAMAATSALDMMMPGAGAAAKIGIQLANRTIGYGAQNAGIAASGLMETLSIGDNPRGGLGNSWLGKLAGGLAGAAPALPNLAGKKPPGPMDQATGSQGKGDTVINQNDQSINVKNEKASEDQTGKVIAEHRAAMFSPAGRQ